MTHQEALDKVLRSYQRYYNINRETPAAPFSAEAVFQMHDEQYFLFKSAKLSELDSCQFVFFADVGILDEDLLARLDERAWGEGLSRVRPEKNHRNSDVHLIILADRIDPAAAAAIRRTRHYKSYRFGLRGWSSYSLIAYELPTGSLVSNRQGRDLKKLFGNK